MKMAEVQCFVCFKKIGNEFYTSSNIFGDIMIRHTSCKLIAEQVYPVIMEDTGFKLHYTLDHKYDRVCDDCKNKEYPARKQTEPMTADDVLDIRNEIRHK